MFLNYLYLFFRSFNQRNQTRIRTSILNQPFIAKGTPTNKLLVNDLGAMQNNNDIELNELDLDTTAATTTMAKKKNDNVKLAKQNKDGNKFIEMNPTLRSLDTQDLIAKAKESNVTETDNFDFNASLLDADTARDPNKAMAFAFLGKMDQIPAKNSNDFLARLATDFDAASSMKPTDTQRSITAFVKDSVDAKDPVSE